jgi:hypothetical protein
VGGELLTVVANAIQAVVQAASGRPLSS